MSLTALPSSSTPSPSSEQKGQQIKDLIEGKSGSASQLPPKQTKADADGTAMQGAAERSETRAEKTPQPNRPGLEFDDVDSEGQEEVRQQKTLRQFAAEHGIGVKQLMRLVASEPGESDEPISLGQMRDHWLERG